MFLMFPKSFFLSCVGVQICNSWKVFLHLKKHLKCKSRLRACPKIEAKREINNQYQLAYISTAPPGNFHWCL